MKSSKRLATFSLIIMALVSTPRAVQQLRNSIDAAQERAGAAWWNLLLTPEAHASENVAAVAVNPCPREQQQQPAQLIAASFNAQANEAAQAKAQAARTTTSAKAKAQARTTRRQNDAAGVTATDGSELVAASMPRKQASHALDAPKAKEVWTVERIQGELAALDAHDAPADLPQVHAFKEVEPGQFIDMPRMNALVEVLAKKGINFQFKMKKGPDRNQLPRPPRVGAPAVLISRDGRPLPVVYRPSQPEGQAME